MKPPIGVTYRHPIAWSLAPGSVLDGSDSLVLPDIIRSADWTDYATSAARKSLRSDRVQVLLLASDGTFAVRANLVLSD